MYIMIDYPPVHRAYLVTEVILIFASLIRYSDIPVKALRNPSASNQKSIQNAILPPGKNSSK